MNLILESKNLIYKPMCIEDAAALFEMDKNPNVHQYLWQNPILDIKEVYNGCTTKCTF